MPQKNYLITHGDLDGVGCAVLVKALLHQYYWDVSFVNYQNIDDIVLEKIEQLRKNPDSSLLITDICPTEEICKIIDQAYKKNLSIKVIDHHKTRSFVCKYPWAIFNTEYSGTLLTYAMLLEVPPDRAFQEQEEAVYFFRFVRGIDAWDRWKLKDPYRKLGEDLNSLRYAVGNQKALQIWINDVAAHEKEPYRTILENIEDDKKKAIAKGIAEAQKTEYQMDGLGNTYKLIFGSEFTSEVASAILSHSDFSDLHYVAIINIQYDKCELRSKENGTDVSYIAKTMKGGGHPTAAGFPLSELRKIYRRLSAKLQDIN